MLKENMLFKKFGLRTYTSTRMANVVEQSVLQAEMPRRDPRVATRCPNLPPLRRRAGWVTPTHHRPWISFTVFRSRTRPAADPFMTRPDTIIIDGHAFSWKRLAAIRRAQIEARQATQSIQPTLFELKDNCRRSLNAPPPAGFGSHPHR
jgi:hypothetical protein